MSAESNSQEALLQFMYLAPIGLIQTDARGQIELMNPMAAQLLMPLLPDGDLENLFDALNQHSPELQKLADQYAEPSGTVCDSLRFALPSPNSLERHRQPPRILAISLLKLDEDHFIACLSDVTTLAMHEQARLDESLQKAARIDALTGLANRAAAHELLVSAISELNRRPGSAFALLFLNSDRFNLINSTYGQAAGDELVRAIATRLIGLTATGFGRSNTTGPGSAFGPTLKPVVARLGSDEFMVLIHHPISCDAVLTEASLLADRLALPYQVAGHQIHTSTSIGLSYCRASAHRPTAEAVLQDASIAMRDAKRAGGGRCHLFIDQMRAYARKRGTLELQLRKAIERDELFVEYQPIIDLYNTAWVGVEALVRWHSPELGILPPFEFIGIAEECGLIVPLGLFVMRRACSQFAAWRLQSPQSAPSSLSVNLSRAQLLDDALVDQIAQILTDTGVPARRLQLEVTESLAAQSNAICERLATLKAMGIGIALDDFGTGYSSLSSLHQLPVDTVKIDQSFVRQLCTSDHHRVLVQATVLVAQNLKMNTVAEGIETGEQAELLRALRCDKGQGYLFGRPMAATAIPQWIQQWAHQDLTGRAQAKTTDEAKAIRREKSA